MAALIYSLIILSVVGLAAINAARREGWQRSLGFLVIWGGVFLLVFVVYSMRFEFMSIADKVIAEFNPKRAIVEKDRVLVRRDISGHYKVYVTIRDVEVEMLVDTGASKIVLTPSDAQKIGFNVNEMIYDRPMMTAGGVVNGARVFLSKVRIGNIEVEDVEAYISKINMEESLLGVNFLGRLDSYNFNEQGMEMLKNRTETR